MVIEERELHYAPDSPLRAWRLFRVRDFDADVVLSSPMYHDPDPHPLSWKGGGRAAIAVRPVGTGELIRFRFRTHGGERRGGFVPETSGDVVSIGCAVIDEEIVDLFCGRGCKSRASSRSSRRW